MNYWCNDCCQKMKHFFNEKYGKNNWGFCNCDTLPIIKNGDFICTLFPPLLKVEVPVKLKNGEYSKSQTRKTHISDYTFCPFCGKKIEIKEAKKENLNG